jgi:MFS family permease
LHPRSITAVGFAALAAALVWLSMLMTPDVSLWLMLFPMALMGAGSACIWAPLTATATRNLPMDLAGAGSGVYNATRQIGAVLGSAAIAVLMDARLAANGLVFDPSKASGSELPPQVHEQFSNAMAEALLLTPAVLVLGLLAAFLFARPVHAQHHQPAEVLGTGRPL